MNKKNNILIFSLLLILFISMSAISAADTNLNNTSNNEKLKATTIKDTTTHTKDNNARIKTANVKNKLKEGKTKSFNDLPTTGSIDLDSDVTYKSGDGTIGIPNKQSLTINGKGHTIDAKNKIRIFTVGTGAKLTLNNVNLINGFVSGGAGGAILNSGNIKLTNCNFTNCKVVGSTSNGGAISSAGSANIIKCTFNQCSAGNEGGAIISSAGSTTLKQCNFNQCSAKNLGGAVRGEKLTIKQCKFNKCSTGTMGSAIFGNGNKIYNCNFNGNTAGYGGTIGGTPDIIHNSNFKNCSFKDLPTVGSIDLDSDVVYKSGDGTIGIPNYQSLTINGKGHTIDAKNKIRIFTVGTGAKLTLNNVKIINGFTSKEKSGGAILNSGYISLTNCNFTNCKATKTGDKCGGGAISGGGSSTIVKCNFNQCYAGNEGGALLSSAGSTTLKQCNFNQCSAKNLGGAVRGEKLTIKQCKFNKCSAETMGGAIFGNGNKIYNCNFNGDTAGYGGAIGGTPDIIRKSNFKNCKATEACKATNDEDDDGGGACSGDFPRIESCTFTNCKAPKAFGGAVRGTANIYNCEFINCAAKQGGAIRGKGETINCIFKNCVATNNMGGAIFNEKATVKKCAFIECSATKSHGGAIYVGNNVNVNNCKFTKCSAPNGCGGAIYGNGVVKKCTFESNSANYGGAVSSYSLTVKSSTFTANSANKGGAAYETKSLTSCTFNKNTANECGGAICNGQNVISSKFIDNFAKKGAVSYNDVNVVFKKVDIKNTINLVKGLFYNDKKKLTLTDSTIINSGKFGEYLNYNTGVFIYNANKLTPKVKNIAGPKKEQKK